MYFIYILQCKDDTLYTGITTDVTRRLQEHKEGRGGRYTRSKGATRIVYFEKAAHRSAALIREAEIKKWSRQKKLDFIRDVV